MLSFARDGFTSSGSTPMNNMATNGERLFLPEEIIFNILKRLPVKSLMRFKCVCKHWKNLFKTPSFIQEHLRHSTHQNSSLVIGPGYSDYGFYLLLFNSKMQFREFEIAPLIASLEDLSIVGSCNGLFCFVQWGKHHADPLLWNPATREIKEIPVSCNGFSDSDSYSESDSDSELDWNFGFGFSPVINDYKIVKIFKNGMICEVGVYSLSTGCWRNISFDNIKDVCISGHSVTANGVIFWCGSKYVMGRHDRNVIVSFDLVTEVFTVIPWPAFTSYSENLAVYDDKLAIIFYDNTRNSQHFSLYFGVMEERTTDSSGERWSSSKKYIGNSDSIYFPWAWTIWRNQIVSMDLRRSMFSHYGMKNPKHIYLIDVIANEFKQFDISEFKCSLCMNVFNYVESLVTVSGNFQIEEP